MYGTPSVHAPQYNDLAGLGRILSRIEVGPLLALFQRKPGRGRPPYDRLPIIYAYLSAFYLNVRTTQGLVDRLNNDPALRGACGFSNRIPHRSTFSRTFSRLSAHRELVHEVFEALTRQALELAPSFGDLLAIDSTTVPTYSNVNHRDTRDPEAGWTKAYAADAMDDDGKIWVFGYKAHVLGCVESCLPLAVIVQPANTYDGAYLPALTEKVLTAYPDLQPYAMMADKGYDTIANSQFLHGQGIAPIIPRRDFSRGSADEDLYSLRGEPRCIGGLEMEFIGTDPYTGRHRFRCPAGGCYRRDEPFKGYAVCGDESWEDPDTEVYYVGGIVSRASAEWDQLYDRRWEIERYFSLIKGNLWIEGHRHRGLARVELHIMLAIVMYQAMVLDRMLEEGAKASRSGLFR